MTSREAPKPLTEEQRNQVRSLLKQLGEASVIRSKSKRKHSTKNSTVSKRRKTTSKHLSLKYIKPKLEDSPFDGIEEGKTVDGIGLPPTCYTMPVVQRVRLMLIPLFYDDVPVDREFLIKMVKEDLGAELSVADAGTNDTLRFVVDGNPPIKNLYIYLRPCLTDDKKYCIANWMYAT